MMWINLTNRLFGWEWVIVKTALHHMTKHVKRVRATGQSYVTVYGHICLMAPDGTFSAAPDYVERWTPLTWKEDPVPTPEAE